MLWPGILIVEPSQAMLESSLVPDRLIQRRVDLSSATSYFDVENISVIDARGKDYGLHVTTVMGRNLDHEDAEDPITIWIQLTPVPAQGIEWLEFRGRTGSVARLVPALPGSVHVSDTTRVPAYAPGAGLGDLALEVIGHVLARPAIPEESLRRYCSTLLARVAQLQKAGVLNVERSLLRDVERLVSTIAEGESRENLPAAWRGMLDAADLVDGPRRHVDVDTVLPTLDKVTVQVVAVISEPSYWQVKMRVEPEWWHYGEGRHTKCPALSIHVADDAGGTYVSSFGGSARHDDHDDMTLRFRPRLDPKAHTVKFEFAGNTNAVTLIVDVGGRDEPLGAK